jgi:hypothetical protein
MKSLKIISLCGCLLFALASCSNDDCISPDVQYESVDSSVKFSELSEILSQIVTDETTQGDVYVLFYDGTYNVLSEEDYLLCVSVADLLSSGRGPQKAPSASGWKNAGT